MNKFDSGDIMNHAGISRVLCCKKIIIIFPKDSESIFNNKKRTFGGATVQLFHYALELSKNHDVYCLLNETDSVDYDNFPTLKIRFSFGGDDSFLKKITKFHNALHAINPDIIIQRGLTRMSTFLALYCKIYRYKFLFMFAHDRECRGKFQRSGKFNIYFPFLLLFSYKLITQNNYQSKKVPFLFKRKTKKITNGHPIKKSIEADKKGVLWVGRLEPWKRPEICIEAAVNNPDIKFVMVAPADDKCSDYAELIYKKVCYINNIEIIDFVSFKDIDRFFEKARLFLNTSVEEGFPNTFVQACINKTPIVSLNVNPDEFITRNRIGEYCNNDLTAMDRAIKNINNDDILFRLYSDSAADYAKKHHDIEVNTRQLENLF